MRSSTFKTYSHPAISIILVLCVFHLVSANCEKVTIVATDWKSESSELELTFNSDPNKNYQLQTSSNLATFDPPLPIASSLDASISTVSAQVTNSPHNFFKISQISTAPSANDSNTWFKEHSGSQEESHGHYILVCEDGGFLQIGETGIVGRATANILVVKTDSEGEVKWKQEFGEDFGSRNRNMGNSAIEVSDGYIVCGMLNRNSAILKLDKSDGELIGDIHMRDNGGTDAYEHIALHPNGFIVVGYNNAEDPNNTFFTEGRGYLSFYDSALNWTSGKSLNEHLSLAYRIKAEDNNYYISGTTYSPTDTLTYAAIKIDSSGDVLWSNQYGGSDQNHCFGMDVGLDGAIFLTGHTLSGTENWDTYTIKLDENGSVLWETEPIGNPRGFDPRWIHDETWGIQATCDGGCIIAAGTGDEYSYSDTLNGASSDQWEAYIVKIDASGKMQWQATYSSGDFGLLPGDWAAEDIALTSDGGAIVAIDNGQFGFLKLAPF